VNLDLVKVLRREKEGVFIELGIDGVPDIPISKTYVDNVQKLLMSGHNMD
jgi:DNA-binding LytR/AlgR family response regulator